MLWRLRLAVRVKTPRQFIHNKTTEDGRDRRVRTQRFDRVSRSLMWLSPTASAVVINDLSLNLAEWTFF